MSGFGPTGLSVVGHCDESVVAYVETPVTVFLNRGNAKVSLQASYTIGVHQLRIRIQLYPGQVHPVQLGALRIGSKVLTPGFHGVGGSPLVLEGVACFACRGNSSDGTVSIMPRGLRTYIMYSSSLYSRVKLLYSGAGGASSISLQSNTIYLMRDNVTEIAFKPIINPICFIHEDYLWGSEAHPMMRFSWGCGPEDDLGWIIRAQALARGWIVRLMMGSIRRIPPTASGISILGAIYTSLGRVGEWEAMPYGIRRSRASIPLNGMMLALMGHNSPPLQDVVQILSGCGLRREPVGSSAK
jgi:hypothetical protein